jgi:hypothetical protein
VAFDRIADEKIREAIDSGAFSNLRGAGKPLRKKNDDYAGEDWAALNILESNGFLPEWLELRKQIYYEREHVVAAMRAWGDLIVEWGSAHHALAVRAGEIYRAKAVAINAKIDLHNIRCPSIPLEIPRFREDARPKVALPEVDQPS